MAPISVKIKVGIVIIFIESVYTDGEGTRKIKTIIPILTIALNKAGKNIHLFAFGVT
jgi:hypothetical protein